MKLKKTSLSAICIAIATMMMVVAFGCSTLPEVVNGDGSDTTAPTVSITSPVANITIDSNSYTVSGTASDAVGVAGVYFSREGSAFVKLAGTTSWSTNVINLAEGTNAIEIYAKDAAGNQSSTASVLIIVDTPVPDVTVSPGTITTNEAFDAVLSVDTNFGYWSTNGTTFNEFTTAGTTVAISNTTTLQYFGSNSLGTSPIQTVVYTFDTNAPSVIVSPSGNITTNQSFVLTISVDENYGYWSTNFAAFVQFSTNTDVVLSNTGSTTNLRVYGEDVLNNVSTTNATTYVINYPEGIYVSASGDDVNDGLSPANAVLNIQDAIVLAKNAGYTNVYVEAGIYTQGAGLSNTVAGNDYAGVNINNANNINLLGGWNNGFIAQTGYSELDGSGASVSKHIIWVEDTTNLTIDGFVMCDGNANVFDDPLHNVGGGIYFTGVSYSLITNCIINNNSASSGGAGIRVNDLSNTICATVSDNYAAKYGGGVRLDGSYNNISGTISGNRASIGGGVYIYGSYNNISGTISGNTADGTTVDDGGGVFIHTSSSSNTISGTISGNTAADDDDGVGGGVRNDGTYTIISATISGNTASSSGGGGVYNNGSAYWTGDWGSGNTPDDWAGTGPL